ncbi:hypothetical protein B0H19DRAFT_1079130 [Mycena capillaripes]|nr:hypothetical protein B0H19DRAFT_1079130 [Mycena capillaripes]
MPATPSVPVLVTSNITTCLTISRNTLELLAQTLNSPFLAALSNTAGSLLKNIQLIKQNKRDCIQLVQQAQELLDVVITVHLASNTAGELPPDVLGHIGKFTEHAQGRSNKLKIIFQQGAMSALLKDCKAGLQEGFVDFQVESLWLMRDVTKMQENAEQRHQEVLDMIEALSDTASSDAASSVWRIHHLPDMTMTYVLCIDEEDLLEPVYQFQLNLYATIGATDILWSRLRNCGDFKPIDPKITQNCNFGSRYHQHRFFVPCESATTKVELAAIIGAHLGLKPRTHLTRAVVQHFSSGPPSLLLLDNLETVWEPTGTRRDIEGFLCLLTDVDHLALVITMRGAERPANVAWTRPFLLPLKPLVQGAAQKMFMEITDDRYDIDRLCGGRSRIHFIYSLASHRSGLRKWFGEVEESVFGRTSMSRPRWK